MAIVSSDMAERTKLHRWFCRSTSTSSVDGPFDLVELAGLLRSGDITGDTLTQAEGEEGWVLFQDRPEFVSAKDMPADVIYRHLKEESEEQESPWSLRRLYYLGGLILGVAGYALFGGFRPLWHSHWFWHVVSSELQRWLGH